MEATAKGHIDKEISNLQSKKALVLVDNDEPFPEPIKKHTYLFLLNSQIKSQSKALYIFNGKFPTPIVAWQ